MHTDKIKENLQNQLCELETLQSMFYNPGELRIEDVSTIDDIKNYLDGESMLIPPFLDFTININVDGTKFEVCVNLSNEYPNIEPDIYVRNNKLNKKQHADLNKDLGEFISSLERGEPCIFSAVSWLQDNVNKYSNIEEQSQPLPSQETEDKNDKSLERYWIYSHHIYSKTKRREICDLAKTLKLTGFCMPGKPGIICVEGRSSDCSEWWQTIKSMNWKRIFCKINETCLENDDDIETFRKFDTFEEIVFQNAGIKCTHMDMGELFRYLEARQCGHIFKELFGVEAK